MTAAPGPLELLILQPTPFCNINCSYCYLPNRQSTRRMSLETVDRVFEWTFASGLAREPFTLLWHAGEPLVMPVAFYEAAWQCFETHNRAGLPVGQSMQTNATLIDESWCNYFRKHDVNLGVSVDGPAQLHDSRRRTRQGLGTHERVLAGMRLLREREIPFFVITVLTAEALDCADQLFEFYLDQQVAQVCFNVEEIEGPNTSSSLEGMGTPDRFRRFFERFLDLAESVSPPLEVREYSTALEALLGCRYGPGSRTQENKPWAIVNVDCDGNFSTYSPELLGLSSPRHGSFALGNVFDDTLDGVIASPRFQLLESDIAQGVEQCRSRCRYFAFCGGGAPANKYFENGTFDSTETLFCRLHKQACLDVTLDRLERQQPTADRSFCLPESLQESWWNLVADVQPLGSGPEFTRFTTQIAAWLGLEGLAPPAGAVFELIVSAPGLPEIDFGEPPPWGAINLGDETASVGSANLAPGEGVRLGQCSAIRGTTLDNKCPVLLLLIRRGQSVAEIDGRRAARDLC